MNFDELQLSPLLLKALDQKGYTKPSPIQEQAIPYVLNGQDLLGCAQTRNREDSGICPANHTKPDGASQKQAEEEAHPLPDSDAHKGAGAADP